MIPAESVELASAPLVALGAPLHSASLERFEFIQRAGPVGSQKAREATVGEHFAPRLAAGAIIGFVVRVTNSLDGFTAPRTRLPETLSWPQSRADRSSVLAWSGSPKTAVPIHQV